jgi:serine/threonine protein kinase
MGSPTRADAISERSSAQGGVRPEPHADADPSSAAAAGANPLVGMGRLVGGRYLIKRRLGDGRYSDVYLAVDETLSDPSLKQEHRVALHLFHAHVAKQARVLQKLEQVYREPHLWAHPNLLRVRGFGSDRGRYFFVTELLQGVSLRVILADSPEELPSEKEVLAVLRGVGDAVKYAHAKGVVHGDLRPEKIFVTRDYAVKVLDLLPVTLAREGSFFLEDAARQPPDPRDDVYGLACVAYEMWSGRHPFNGNSPREALEADLPLVRIPQLDAQRWAALARGLALRRVARTASMQEFLEEIGVVGDERLQPEPAAPPPAPTARRATPPPEQREPPPEPTIVAPVLHPEPGLFPEPVSRRPPRRRHGGVGWVTMLTAAMALIAVAAIVGYRSFPPFQLQAETWLATVKTRAVELRRAVDEWRDGARPSPVVSPTTEPVVGSAPAPAAIAPLEPVAPLPTVDVPIGAVPTTEPAGDLAAPPAPVDTADPSSGPIEASPPASGITRTESIDQATPADRATPAAAAASVVQPETFAFAVTSIAIGESEASVVAELRRRGGTLGESSVVWWTTDGTALADEDYASFGARVEKFAPGERTLRVLVPIVGDSQVEGHETFYLHARAAEGSARRGAATAQTEILIRDDD